jgi:steroid 5-alpha reductase family enzyme
MFDAPLLLWSLLLMLPLPLLTWIVSLFKRDVSIVDSTWSLMFLALTIAYVGRAWLDGTTQPRAALVLLLVAVWALRLSLYITLRNRGKPEDHRYQAIRRRHEPGFAFKSLYLIFGLQALLAWFISLPLFAAATGSAPLGLLDLIAVLLWLTGFSFEAVADAQLAAFRAEPANSGRVLDSGLWRYTRHPNYFGETLVWWGFYLLAVNAGGWWTLPAPLLMTYLLLRVSGVALLERDISERRPAYREYVQHTNAFIPGPRKPVPASGETGSGA